MRARLAKTARGGLIFGYCFLLYFEGNMFKKLLQSILGRPDDDIRPEASEPMQERADSQRGREDASGDAGERVEHREWRRKGQGHGRRVDLEDEKGGQGSSEGQGREHQREGSGRRGGEENARPRERRRQNSDQNRERERSRGRDGGRGRGPRQERDQRTREGTLHDASGSHGEEWTPSRGGRKRSDTDRGERRRDSRRGEDRGGDNRRREKRREGQGRKPEPRVEIPEPTPPPPMPELIQPPELEGKVRFTDFDIAKEVLCGIQDLGFEYCTPIQAQVFPHVLAHKDMTGKAQTGTGKTAAFLVAALTYMKRTPRRSDLPGTCRMLAIAPTRELAIQIHKDAVAISKYCGLRHHVVYGGMGHQDQREYLERPVDLLVGTPGRLLDYSRSRHLNLRHTEILVIDEADRMLDMGFIPDVRRIVGQLPADRQTLLFSATFTDAVVDLARRWQQEPEQIDVEPEQLVTDLIDQHFYMVQVNEKIACLLWVLKGENPDRSLVFCNRKDTTMLVSRRLREHGVECAVLSGDVAQQKRVKILEAFRKGTLKVVVATDVAARGIHVDDISLVVNYDLPYEADDYVHRVGRTGRAGNRGRAVGFVCEYGAYLVPELEEAMGDKIACSTPPEEALALPERGPVELKPKRRRRRRPKPEEEQSSAAPPVEQPEAAPDEGNEPPADSEIEN